MKSYNGFTGAERAAAQRWLNARFAAGDLLRPTRCDACGQNAGRIDCHAEDYSKPFGPHIYEYKLCYACHMMVHCRFEAPERWREYVQLVGLGWRMAAPVGSYFSFRKYVLGRWGTDGMVLGNPPAMRTLERLSAR